MTRQRSRGKASREEPGLFLTVPPSRRPWAVRGVITGCAAVIAVLWMLFLTGALDGTWGQGVWVGAGSVLVASLGYSAWVVRHGRVVVEGGELVVRPGLVLSHRLRVGDVVAVDTGSTRWRSARLSLRDGRTAPLPALSDADVQRLVEVLRAIQEGQGSHGHHRTVGVADPPGMVRGRGAARWPDPPHACP